MRIFGITGAARSGKDCIGNYLMGLDTRYQHYSFAQPMKEMICTMLSKPKAWLNQHKDEVIPFLDASPRKLLQTLGTDWGRDMIHKDIWLNLGQRFIDNCESARIPGVVITDVRFENEAAMIRMNGGVICHVRREAAPEVRAHVSEAGILHHPTDWAMHNDGTLPELYLKVDQLIAGYDKLVALRRD